MSTLKTNACQLGQSATASNNFTWYQPTVPDGTVRLGQGNSGATTQDVIKCDSSGNMTIPGSIYQAGGTTAAERVVVGTAQTTSGAATYEFTSLPSWVKRITMITDNCKGTNAGIQLGTSAGYVTSGYTGTYSSLTSTLGTSTLSASVVWSTVIDGTYAGYGTLIFTQLGSGNIWSFVGAGSNVSFGRQEIVSGTVTLPSTLDRIRITGTANFTLGTVNIIYEG